MITLLRFTRWAATVVLAALPTVTAYGAMGDLKWSFSFSPFVSDSSAALYFDGIKTNLYIGANDGKMYAFDLNPGSSGT